MYRQSDFERVFQAPNPKQQVNKYRNPFRVDYARLVHSPAFRRLQGKTQLFPGNESDFFRNRLTHSLEVAQIAKSIALRINYEYKFKGPNQIDPDLVEFAGLAHDLGHPPFGHQGEMALHEKMVDYGGFEGTAQTLRILTKLEKKELEHFFENRPVSGKKFNIENRVGLNLTYRTMAAILKYDNEIPVSCPKEVQKGYYHSESQLVESIKQSVLVNQAKIDGVKFKTVECQIMDIADDIAYSTYDLEDTIKAGFANLFDLTFGKNKVALVESINKNLSKDDLYTGISITQKEITSVLMQLFGDNFIFDDEVIDTLEISDSREKDTVKLELAHSLAKDIANNGYFRTSLSSNLVDRFVNNTEFILNPDEPALSKVKLADEQRIEVETLKRLTYNHQINSSKLKIVEYRGKQIVNFLFETLADYKNKGYDLLPDDYRDLYNHAFEEHSQYRIICDFIAGMTDSYAIAFYGRLTSENPETIFKPL